MNHYIDLVSNRYILSALFALITAKLLWSLSQIFLPVSPPQPILARESYQMPEIDHLAYKFLPTKEVEVTLDVLDGIKLKAIYKNGRDGFIVIEEEDGKRYVNLREKYKGYKLISLRSHYAIFKKKRKIYKVILEGYKNEKR